MKIFDSASGKTLRNLEGHKGAVDRLVFSKNGRRLITAGQDRLIMVWDLETSECLKVLRGHRLKVFALADLSGWPIASFGRRRCRAAARRRLKLWNPESGELLYSFEGFDEGVTDLVFSSDASRLDSGQLR